MSGRTKNRKIKKALLIGSVFGVLAGALVTFTAMKIATHKKKSDLEKNIERLKEENNTLKAQADKRRHLSDAAALSEKAADRWELIYVDDRYPLDKKYVPALEEIADGIFVDSRIAKDAKQMLADGQRAGMKFRVTASYRSYDEQRELFNNAMQQRVNNGMGYLDAYDDTKLSAAPPGHSEHATGLALDIVSADYDAGSIEQKDSREAKWLAENCSKYGFIYRYPMDRIDVTDVGYEPAHYRYVGKEAAKEIMAKRMTLEDYLLAR